MGSPNIKQHSQTGDGTLVICMFVFGDYRTTSNVTEMVNQLPWTTLQERRAQAKAVMFRIVNNLVDVPHI